MSLPLTILTATSFPRANDVSRAIYSNKSFDVTSEDALAVGVDFSDTGTAMYVLGDAGDAIFQYTLSTAWDVSTASYSSKTLSVSAQNTNVKNIKFKPDGTKLYLYAANNIYQYTLSTAWDVSTASYDSKTFDTGSQTSTGGDAFFKSDGTKMYALSIVNQAIYQYTLSTAWDVSTASYDSVSASISEDSSPRSLYISKNGRKLHVVGPADETIYQYTLSTAWDLSTLSYDSISFSVFSQTTGPRGLAFGRSGTRFYVIDNSADVIYQYQC